MVEFQNKKLKKWTRCIKLLPDKGSLLRIAAALLIKLAETWFARLHTLQQNLHKVTDIIFYRGIKYVYHQKRNYQTLC